MPRGGAVQGTVDTKRPASGRAPCKLAGAGRRAGRPLRPPYAQRCRQPRRWHHRAHTRACARHPV
eukprot:15478751-Alexandrium_andersonii.AAC.1